MFYAQLNENGICIGVSMLSGAIDAPNMIPIDNMDLDYLGRKYEDGEWSEEKYEPESTAPITEFEQMKTEQESIKQAIAELTMLLATLN